jgi:ribosomal protein S12 methylthiotransferase
LLEALVKVEGIEWIRLHYAFLLVSMDVLEIMKREPKICNYIDIPLQHISDSILKSMRRGTTQEKTTKLLRDFVQRFQRWQLYNLNRRISRRNTRRF